MTAILLRFPGMSPIEYAHGDHDRARQYLRHIQETGTVDDPESGLRLEAAYARLDQALKDRHLAEGWPEPVRRSL